MSDESMRRAGRAELDRLNAASAKEGSQPLPKPKKKKRVSTSWGDLVGIGREKQQRVGTEGETLDEAVDRAVRGAKPDPY